MDITVWIDACKRELGIRSDREFSRLTGISSGLLSKWRKGECSPGTDSLKKIAKATGKDLSILIGYAAGISASDTISDSDTDSEHLISDGISYVDLPEIISGRKRYIRVYKAEEIRNNTFLCHEEPGFANNDSKVPDSINSGYRDPGGLESGSEYSDSKVSENPESDYYPDKYGYIILPDMYEPQDEFFAFSVPDNNMVPELYSGDTVIVHIQDDAADGDTVIACIGQDAAVCAILLHINEGIILNSPSRYPGPAFFSNVSIMDLPVRIIGKVVDLHHRDYK